MQPEPTFDPSKLSVDGLTDEGWKLRHSVWHGAWVQVRYHKRRQRFFDLLDKGTKAVTLVLGGTLFGKDLADVLPWIATAISALGSLALVFGYGDRKQLHKELAEQAIGLIARIDGLPAAKVVDVTAAEWAAEYTRFCGKAPPPLKTLTLICAHEQAVSEGHPDHVKMPSFWRCCLSQVMS